MLGCFFDRYHHGWQEPAIDWFEALLDYDDVDIMAWALGTQEPPEAMQGNLMETMQKLDYVEIPR